MREVGSVWFVYSTTLLESAKGETDDLGYVTKRLVLVFYTLSLPIPCLGAGQDGKWRTGGRRLGPAGKSKSSLERGLWGCAGADRNGHILSKK